MSKSVRELSGELEGMIKRDILDKYNPSLADHCLIQCDGDFYRGILKVTIVYRRGYPHRWVVLSIPFDYLSETGILPEAIDYYVQQLKQHLPKEGES